MAQSFANLQNSAGDVTRSYLSSFTSRDPVVIASHVSDDFVNEHTSALGQGCRGRASYQDRLAGFLEDMQDLRYEIEDLVEQDDKVMVTYLMTARWQGDTPISVRGAQSLLVIDGKIARRVDYWDSGAFLLQAVPDAAETLASFGLQLPASRPGPN